MNVTETIKTFDDACKAMGVIPEEVLPFIDPTDGDKRSINAYAKLIVIAQALNEGWTPDWNNDDEYKYYQWWDMETYPDQVGSGAGFSFDGCDYERSGTDVGSRLCFKTRELAEYAGKQFTDIYREYFVIE